MAFMDLVLAAIPVHMIWSLQQMDKKKKLAICGLLSTGWTAFGFSIVKTIQLENIANRDDITWATVWLFVWNAFEINIVITAACIPTLVPLYEVLNGKRKASQYDKTPNQLRNSFRGLRNPVDGSNGHLGYGHAENGVDTLILDEAVHMG